jgi:uncharacterized cupin superfamily protein
VSGTSARTASGTASSGIKLPGVVVVGEIAAEKRPRYVTGEGVASRVRPISDAAGLTQMGVGVRIVEPGFLGSNRHFHTVEEEWIYVLSGSGVARIGPQRINVRAGCFIGYPPGPRPHDLRAQGNEPLVLLEGGERRKQEEHGWYVDMGLRWRGRKLEKIETPPPPEEGGAEQCTALDACEIVRFDHPVDTSAHRAMRFLSAGTGLSRQAVSWVRVAEGDRSTAFHTHTRTDEWVYILEGRAELRVGDARCEIGPGEFIAHPAGGPPHVMEPIEELTYLMGGQRDPDDVVLYPEHAKKLEGGRLEQWEPEAGL